MPRQVLVSLRFLADSNWLAVIAAKFSCGAPRDGAQYGPGAVIDSGVFKDIQSMSKYTFSFDCLSQEDPSIERDPDFGGMKRPRAVSLATKQISEHVYAHARRGNFVMTLGGDHSVGIGSVSGMARAIQERFKGKELAVLWIDAHADINTPQTSPSGRIHGMPVAFVSGLAKVYEGHPFDWVKGFGLINLQKVVYIGLRDIDEAENGLIEQHGIKAFSMDDVRARGIQAVMDSSLDYIGKDTPMYVSYDIDSLDPEWAPSTGFPVASGLSLDEGIQILQRLHSTRNMVGMDLVEINPLIESSQLSVTLESASLLIKSVLGLHG